MVCPYKKMLFEKKKENVIQSKKKNEVLIHVTAWMSLENLMLSERSQSHII